MEYIGTIVELEVTKEQRNAAIMAGSDAPNVLIECAEPVEAILPFGIKRSSTNVYLMVDNAEAFRQRLSATLSSREGK